MPSAELTKALAIVGVVAEAIQELGSVPNGVLYAHLMSKFDLDTYNKIISTLKKAELIKEEYNVLTWIGPEKQ